MFAKHSNCLRLCMRNCDTGPPISRLSTELHTNVHGVTTKESQIMVSQGHMGRVAPNCYGGWCCRGCCVAGLMHFSCRTTGSLSIRNFGLSVFLVLWASHVAHVSKQNIVIIFHSSRRLPLIGEKIVCCYM